MRPASSGDRSGGCAGRPRPCLRCRLYPREALIWQRISVLAGPGPLRNALHRTSVLVRGASCGRSKPSLTHAHGDVHTMTHARPHARCPCHFGVGAHTQCLTRTAVAHIVLHAPHGAAVASAAPPTAGPGSTAPPLYPTTATPEGSCCTGELLQRAQDASAQRPPLLLPLHAHHAVHAAHVLPARRERRGQQAGIRERRRLDAAHINCRGLCGGVKLSLTPSVRRRVRAAPP